MRKLPHNVDMSKLIDHFGFLPIEQKIGSSLFCVGNLDYVIGNCIYQIDDSCCTIVNSMARKSHQGQALRVLASSQPCSLSLAMLT